MPQEHKKPKPLKSDVILGRTPSYVPRQTLSGNPKEEAKQAAFVRQQKLKNDPIETLRERDRERANLEAWAASAQYETAVDEAHAYDFRKQKGKRAPLMMKKGK